jgi:mannose-6-phosphate isomerase-like protein (cupin superfamily)
MTKAGALRPDELAPGPPTPGMTRLQAYAGEDRWVGHVSSAAGVKSGWHHHGDHDTYFYVLTGTIRIELEGDESFDVQTGDFAHIPKGTIHREGPLGDEPIECIVIRMGTGPQAFDVPDPQEAPTTG